MKKMTDFEKLLSPFGITIRQRKISYCNNNVVSCLQELGIEWDMTVERIIFCNRRFPMSTIDNGEAERFIQKIIIKRNKITRQSSLEEY